LGAGASLRPATTWIYRILVNGCIDRRRRRGLRALAGLGDVETEAVPDPAPDAFTVAGDRQRLARVREGLGRLGARQRMAVLLSAVAGLDTAAIAETMGTTTGGVEQLLVRARRSLRAHLEEAERVGRGAPEGAGR